MKQIKILAIFLLIATVFVFCGKKTSSGRPKISIKGEIIIKLYEKEAPETAANFKQYVESGFYDDTIFHRVIPGFVVQGGGFTGEMQQKQTKKPIKNEAGNGLKNSVGTLSMARTQDIHSATSQFFINLVDNKMLDHTDETARGFGYCVFAEITEGMDIVNQIAGVETSTSGFHRDVPVTPIYVTKASMLDNATVKFEVSTK